MDTIDNGGGSGGSGIAHSRGEGNSGYSVSVNRAGVGMEGCTMCGSGKGRVVDAIAPVVTVVTAAASVVSATFTDGAIFAPATTVGHFTSRSVLG